MLHVNKQTFWIEDTTSYMPVQAAHNLAAAHYACDSRQKQQTNGGNGADGKKAGAGQAAKDSPKWTTAHPMASVSSVLMQSVEPLEDVISNVTELMPMTNATAPSAAEARIAVARRRILGRERAQLVETFAGRDRGSPEQEPPQTRNEGYQIPTSARNEAIVTPMPSAPMECTSTHRIRFIDLEAQPDRKSVDNTDGTLEAQVANELVPEASHDSRLVLPVLESLIALRRSRLNRAARPPTMSVNGGSGANSTAAGEVVTWYGGAAGAPPAVTKVSGAKPTTRFGAQTGTASSGAIATCSCSQLRQSNSGTASQPDGSTGSSRSQVPLSGMAWMQPAPPLSQFPGPFRSTRKWEVFLPEGLVINPAAGGATAVAAAAAVGVPPSGASVSTVPRSGGGGVAAAAAAAHAHGISWAGNESSLERSATTARSFTTGSRQPGVAIAAAPPNPQLTLVSPTRPPASGATCAAGTAAGTSSDVSASACRTSRLSPRPSIDLGLGSSADEALEDSCGMPRSVARQRALLQEWQEWREAGSPGPPPGIDEETDCSDAGDCGGAAAPARAGAMHDTDTDTDMGDDDDDDCGLLLGLPNMHTSVTKPVMASPKIAAGTGAAAATGAAFTMVAGAAATNNDDDESSPEGHRKTWRRARRITQSFDMLGLECLNMASAPGTMASMSAPLGSAVGPASPGAPVASPVSAAGTPAIAVLSGMLSPTATTSPPPVASASGTGAAQLSPMASRRRIDSSGGRPGVGPLALPIWLNKAFGGGTESAGLCTAPMSTMLDDEDGGHEMVASAASCPVAASAATAGRIPLLTTAKHLSFTSKFNRFKEQIQSLSLTIASKHRELAERVPSIMGPGGGVGPRPRVAISNDGRGAFVGGPVAVTQGRKAPPGPTAATAFAGPASVVSPDLSARRGARGPVDIAPSSKPQQQQGGGPAVSVRIPARHSLDSRLSTSRVRNTHDAAVSAAPPATVAGGLAPTQQQGGGVRHDMLVVTSAPADRSRRGGGGAGDLLPPVRLL